MRHMTQVWLQVSLVTLPRSRPSQMWRYNCSVQDEVYWSGHTTVTINSPSTGQGVNHVLLVSASCNSLSSNARSTRCFITKRPFRWNTGMSHLYLSNHVLFSGRLMSTSWRTNCRDTSRQREKDRNLCFWVTPTTQVRCGRDRQTDKDRQAGRSSRLLTVTALQLHISSICWCNSITAQNREHGRVGKEASVSLCVWEDPELL